MGRVWVEFGSGLPLYNSHEPPTVFNDRLLSSKRVNFVFPRNNGRYKIRANLSGVITKIPLPNAFETLSTLPISRCHPRFSSFFSFSSPWQWSSVRVLDSFKAKRNISSLVVIALTESLTECASYFVPACDVTCPRIQRERDECCRFLCIYQSLFANNVHEICIWVE